MNSVIELADKMKKPSDHIVITGNPVDGLSFYGTFESAGEAAKWAEMAPLDGQDWWVAPLESPNIERMTIVNDEQYPVTDWKYEVANGDTRLGYHDWVMARKEQEGD